MDALLGSLGNLLAVFKDPVNVVLLLVCVSEGYFIYVLRRENREDRDKLIPVLNKIGDSLDNMRQFLAAHTGEIVNEHPH